MARPTPPPTRPAPVEPIGTICDKYGSMRVQDGRYIVQNNNWGSDISQCIAVTGAGFAVSSGSHAKPTDGPPGSYPSIFAGCHYGNCSAGSGLPAPLPSLASVDASVAYTPAPAGEWNAAFDLWFDPAAKTDGQNNGAEIMVWLDHRGRPQPVGSQIATATLAGATWDVWAGRVEGSGGWNVISYVRQDPVASFSGDLLAFADDAIGRGRLGPAWHLTSVQFGFEPWVGGPGLSVESFSAAVEAR